MYDICVYNVIKIGFLKKNCNNKYRYSMVKQIKVLDNLGSKKILEKLLNIFFDIFLYEMFCELRFFLFIFTFRIVIFGSVLYKYRDVFKLEDYVGNFIEEIVEEMINRCVYFYVCFNVLFILNIYFI